ncbi:MAG TPA: class I SAM-dependent methyltransferase [Longimicrobiales bacterium]|nr:class I SAM-dependent methyltransferase [Longimicrobiales bacterium]
MHPARRELKRIIAQARKLLLRRRIGERWADRDGGFGSRLYPDYDSYLEHQRTKLDALRAKSIRGHDRRFYDALQERLPQLSIDLHGRNVLCLAARQGTEVRAFIEQGAFAVGIDLNPGPDNRYVLVGDFHDLQFADGTVDVVYTNSLDHAFNLDQILAEVQRVLVPGGWFIAEVGVGTAQDARHGRGPYESFSWTSVAELIARIAERGFVLESRRPFERPWAGEQLVLRHAPD